MRVWRISPAKRSALDGEGARRAGGRWNRPGTRVVYTSATLSLAALEYFVNVDPENLPGRLVSRSADVPADLEIERIEARGLSSDWRRYPAPPALAEAGTEWALSGRTAILGVPSAVIPQELNYLLNPVHPDFRRIAPQPPVPFQFGPRMWRTRPLG